MQRRPWLERVAEELARQRLPGTVRTRLLAELRDHLEDLAEGGIDVETEREPELQMGSPEDLASGAAAEYRSAWVRRHPLLVFAVAPAPLAILGVVAYMLSAAAAAYAVAAVGYHGEGFQAIPRSVLEPLASGFACSIRFVPFLLVVAAFGWLGLRYRVGRWWLAAALIQIALLGGAATAQLSVSELPGESQLSVGLSSPVGWLQGVQLLLPLMVGWWFLRVTARREKTALSVS